MVKLPPPPLLKQDPGANITGMEAEQISAWSQGGEWNPEPEPTFPSVNPTPPSVSGGTGFYANLGYPQYEGVYEVPDVPLGYHVSEIKETPSGLQLQYAPNATGFYTQLGYPQYEGKYQPFTVPAGSRVSGITETPSGLQISFETEDEIASKTFYTNLGYPQYGGKYAPFEIPADSKLVGLTEIQDNPDTPEIESGLKAEFESTVSAPSSGFYTALGFPQYEGKYEPFTIPQGYTLGSITPTAQGLQIQFKPVDVVASGGFGPLPSGAAFSQFTSQFPQPQPVITKVSQPAVPAGYDMQVIPQVMGVTYGKPGVIPTPVVYVPTGYKVAGVATLTTIPQVAGITYGPGKGSPTPVAVTIPISKTVTAAPTPTNYEKNPELFASQIDVSGPITPATLKKSDYAVGVAPLLRSAMATTTPQDILTATLVIGAGAAFVAAPVAAAINTGVGIGLAQASKFAGLEISFSKGITVNPSLTMDRLLTPTEVVVAGATMAVFNAGAGIIGKAVGLAVAPTGLIGSAVSPTVATVAEVGLRGAGLAGVGATVGYLATGQVEGAALGAIIAGTGSVLYDVARLGIFPRIKGMVTDSLTKSYDVAVRNQELWEPSLKQRVVMQLTGAKPRGFSEGTVSIPLEMKRVGNVLAIDYDSGADAFDLSIAPKQSAKMLNKTPSFSTLLSKNAQLSTTMEYGIVTDLTISHTELRQLTPNPVATPNETPTYFGMGKPYQSGFGEKAVLFEFKYNGPQEVEPMPSDWLSPAKEVPQAPSFTEGLPQGRSPLTIDFNAGDVGPLGADMGQLETALESRYGLSRYVEGPAQKPVTSLINEPVTKTTTPSVILSGMPKQVSTARAKTRTEMEWEIVTYPDVLQHPEPLQNRVPSFSEVATSSFGSALIGAMLTKDSQSAILQSTLSKQSSLIQGFAELYKPLMTTNVMQSLVRGQPQTVIPRTGQDLFNIALPFQAERSGLIAEQLLNVKEMLDTSLLQGLATAYGRATYPTGFVPRIPQTKETPLSYPSSPLDLPFGSGKMFGKNPSGYLKGIWEFPVKGPEELLGFKLPRVRGRRKRR